MELDLNHNNTKLNQLEECNIKQLLQHLFEELEKKVRELLFRTNTLWNWRTEFMTKNDFLPKTRFSKMYPFITMKIILWRNKNVIFLRDYLSFEAFSGKFKSRRPLGP